MWGIPGLTAGESLNAVSLHATLTTYELDATENWWGTANKDSVALLIDGSVDYTPWWYDETGASSDETSPTITFTETPYSSELGEATSITITISDDSGIQSYSIDWADGTSTGTVDGTGNTSINIVKSITYSDIGEYVISVNANDAVDNSATNTVDVTVYESPDWIIELKEGWNLVSFPLVLEDSDIDVVLEDIYDDIAYESGVYTILKYDATSGWEKAKRYEQGSSYYGQFTGSMDIEPGYAYWIKMKNDAVLYGSEKEFAPGEMPLPSIELATGSWNLVGRYGVGTDDVLTPTNAFVYDLTSNFYEPVLEYDGTTWNSASHINTYGGYWLRTKVSEQNTLAYEPGAYYL